MESFKLIKVDSYTEIKDVVKNHHEYLLHLDKEMRKYDKEIINALNGNCTEPEEGKLLLLKEALENLLFAIVNLFKFKK